MLKLPKNFLLVAASTLLFAGFSNAEPDQSNYLTNADLSAIDIASLIPASPKVDTEADRNDVAYFWSGRALISTARGHEAAEDDVYQSEAVWLRFAPVINLPNEPPSEKLKPLFNLMTKAVHDAESLVKPIKKNPPEGRVRPFVQFAGSPTCLEPYDLVLGHKEIDYSFHLKESGSYPSTHATIGILWAKVLGQIYHDREFQLIERGISFGESRAVCGFHYESDVSAGRIAGSALFEKLMSNKKFRAELDGVKKSLSMK